MAKTLEEKALEQQKLKDLSPYSLPDNPTAKGWSSGQIKAKMYKGLFYLYNLLDESRTDVANIQNTLENIDLDYVTEEEAKVITQNAMPYVSDTPPDVNKTMVWLDISENEIIDNGEEVLDVEPQVLMTNRNRNIVNETSDIPSIKPSVDNLQFETTSNSNLSFGEDNVEEIVSEPSENLSFSESDNQTLSFNGNDERLSFENSEENLLFNEESNESLSFENSQTSHYDNLIIENATNESLSFESLGGEILQFEN